MSFKTWFAKLPGVQYLIDVRSDLQAIRWDLAAARKTAQLQLEATAAEFVDRLLTDARYADPRVLAHHELRVHSQSGEDGVIAEIYRRIGPGDRTFIEFGVESGVETNTTLLLRQGWRGWWVEGSAERAARARELFAPEIAEGRLTIIEAFVTAENAVQLLADAGAPARVDLLSLDIDRNTWHLWKALGGLPARVVVAEYNASFGPTTDWVIDYDATAWWNGTVNFGSSLAAFERLGRELGYALVGCGLNGSNAFFVTAPLADDRFAGPFTSARHWEPPRYFLDSRGGHPTGPIR
ncbi:MAG: hypothetical protein ACYC3L_03555 [Gemmatimonadaceae bacterium]